MSISSLQGGNVISLVPQLGVLGLSGNGTFNLVRREVMFRRRTKKVLGRDLFSKNSDGTPGRFTVVPRIRKGKIHRLCVKKGFRSSRKYGDRGK